MKFDIITLFPEMFGPLDTSLLGKAKHKNIIDYKITHLRDFAINKYGQVDDYPYGGEAGMVIRPEPVNDAINSLNLDEDCEIIHMSPQGQVFTQEIAQELSKKKNIVFLCGHYKGIDERVVEKHCTRELSVGDYVLTGGELPAMIMIDAITRLIPGVMSDFNSAETDSFYTGKLGWPVYTRPAKFEERDVPPILLSGHHKNIDTWRKDQANERTKLRRPDLLSNKE
ncbi:tRNA (guanosine(37)-N1)-methyltransferase TrmD [Fibrobacterales bacterium]|nr:tRNA (guanosine(37)-N1)-methyltransferase TrmD [Fibrobacterales bacterium]